MNYKKRILWMSDGVCAATGLGNVTRRLLTRFWKSKKYDIFHLSQGIGKNNPEQYKVPWKVWGTIPEDHNIISRMNSDPGFARNVSYGDSMLEEAVKEFKPDIVVLANDPWGSSDLGVKKFFWNKIYCIAYETYDSLPLYQPSLDNINKLKNLFCWSTFAEEEFHRLGYKHVKTIFPPIDTEKYFILSEEERNKNRDFFSVDRNLFIVSYVFRNQLRKQSHTIIQALSLIKKKYPNIYNNIRFYMHTSGDEGWSHHKFCQQYDVDYNHLFYTWLCQNCKNIEIKSDDHIKSQDGKFAHKCKHCGGEQRNPSVGGGCTIEQMNQIFNVGDCFTLVGNSGASELPGLEAMSCGIPLATIDYAYGHDFCKNDFVYKLNFSTSVEFGTQFLKATPDPNSIMDFILKIYHSNKEERTKIGIKSREWIVNNFDADLIANKWMQLFDSIDKTDWDFKFEQQLKDPNIQIEDISDNLQFIKQLYSKILKMDDLPDNDSGVIHWLTQLNNGMVRQDIIKYFQSVAIQKNQEIEQQKNKSGFEGQLDNNGKKRFLLVVPESIGDCVISLGILESLYKNYPPNEWNIYLATNPVNFDVYKGCEFIYKIIEYNNQMDSEPIMTGIGSHKGYFDGYCFLTAPTQKFLNYLTNDNLNIEINA